MEVILDKRWRRRSGRHILDRYCSPGGRVKRVLRVVHIEFTGSLHSSSIPRDSREHHYFQLDGDSDSHVRALSHWLPPSHGLARGKS